MLGLAEPGGQLTPRLVQNSFFPNLPVKKEIIKIFVDGNSRLVKLSEEIVKKCGQLTPISKKIQQTKMLVTCQRFGDLFLFGLGLQYSSVQTKYDKSRFKVMATYLQQ